MPILERILNEPARVTRASVTFLVIACTALIVQSIASLALASELTDRMTWWRSQAFRCNTDGMTFPSRPTGQPSQPCDDGDMTLFNGLLCAAGDEEGCEGVRQSQDADTGEWFRSPRIRLHGNDRGGSSFSPDMALGVQLYLVTKKDSPSAKKWLLWLDAHVPCAVELFGKCQKRGLIPRFCTDDAEEKGCTMRPGDAAMLSATVTYLQDTASLETLPDGPLRGYLGTFSGYGPAIEEIDSIVNKPGYSQHIVAVSLLLMKLEAQNDARLFNAAKRLLAKNPGNAFFSYLAEAPRDEVQEQTFSRCPAVGVRPTAPLDQWQWERDNGEQAWKHSAYWDCIFMGRLLRP